MSNYPAGVSDHNIDALLGNEPEREEIEKNTDVSISLSHSNVYLATTNYIAEEWEDWDRDGDEIIHSGGTYYDFSETNWEEEYQKDGFFILTLLEEYAKKLEVDRDFIKAYLERDMKQLEEAEKIGTDKKRISHLKSVIKSKKKKIDYLNSKIDACRDWVIDDINVCLDD